MAFLAPLAVPLAVAGTGLKAVGTLTSGMYNAQVADNNAKIATMNANYSRQAGQTRAGLTSMKGAARQASVKASQAASGVDVNTGSAARVQEGERMVSKFDVDTVLQSSELEAYGYTTQAKSFRAQAQQERTAAVIGAVGDLLSGASSIATPTPTA